MATPNPITQKRIYRDVFVCMKCGAKLRSDPNRVKEKKVRCRKCGYKGLRPKHKTVKAKG